MGFLLTISFSRKTTLQKIHFNCCTHNTQHARTYTEHWTPNVERSMRSDHMPMSHQWQNNQTHQSALNGAYLYRIDAKVCCHFWGFDKSMKCKKGLAYYSIHKKKPIVLSWLFRNVYSHQRCHFTLNYFLIHFNENSIYAHIVCSYFALNRSIRNHICLEIKKKEFLIWNSPDTKIQKKMNF